MGRELARSSSIGPGSSGISSSCARETTASSSSEKEKIESHDCHVITVPEREVLGSSVRVAVVVCAPYSITTDAIVTLIDCTDRQTCIIRTRVTTPTVGPL